MAPLTGGSTSSGAGSTGGGTTTPRVTAVRVIADAEVPVTMLRSGPIASQVEEVLG